MTIGLSSRHAHPGNMLSLSSRNQTGGQRIRQPASQRHKRTPTQCAASPNRGSLKLFLDSASLDSWKHLQPLGIFTGITTNPLILQRGEVRCTVHSLDVFTRKAFDLGAQEMQLQSWGTTAEDLFAVGEQLARIDARVVVKLPITRAGAAAAARLVAGGTRVTLTGLYTAHQAFTAAALGAEYAAPYLGRMNDSGKQGTDEILQMQSMLEGCGSGMRLLVASVRQPQDLMALAAQGCDTFTISPDCAEKLFDEPLTIAAAEDFEERARAMGAYLA